MVELAPEPTRADTPSRRAAEGGDVAEALTAVREAAVAAATRLEADRALALRLSAHSDVAAAELDAIDAIATELHEIPAVVADAEAALSTARVDAPSAVDALEVLHAQAASIGAGLRSAADRLPSGASTDADPARRVAADLEAALSRALAAARVAQEGAAAGPGARDPARGAARGAAAAVDTPPTSTDSRQTPAVADERPPPPPPEPEPEPEPEPIRDANDLRFVRSDARSVNEDPGQDAPYISSQDAADAAITRRAVTAEIAGVDTPWQVGEQTVAARPRVRVDQGEDSDARGTPDATERAAAEGAARGGSRDGVARGRGAMGEAGPRRDGGPAAAASPGGQSADASPGLDGRASPSRTARAAIAGAAGPASPGPTEGHAPDDAPEASDLRDADAPGWWRPSVVRVEIPTAPASPAAVAPAIAAASPTDAPGRSPQPRPRDAADRGGAEVPTDTPAAETRADKPDDRPGRRAEDTEAPDPIADLRASLGWGEIDRTTLRPRAAPTGAEAMSGMAPTSQQRVLDDDVDVDRISYVQARGTEVGEYTEAIYARVQHAWHQLDLSPDDKALGVQGEVTVVFRVHRNGRVTDKALLRSSGHAFLDQMALLAIPERLPRIPRRIEDDTLLQQITFRYKNPLVPPPAP